jgi:hypothetical protein
MPTKKIKPIEEVEQYQADVVMPDSDKKQAFRALIEKYKTQNPAKYALKKERLEKKLKEMK